MSFEKKEIEEIKRSLNELKTLGFSQPVQRQVVADILLKFADLVQNIEDYISYIYMKTGIK